MSVPRGAGCSQTRSRKDGKPSKHAEALLGRGVAPKPGRAFNPLASADSLPGQMWYGDFKGEEEPLN